jgi:hypothetical protein
MDRLKSKLLIVVSTLAAIAALIARHFYVQAAKADIKLKHAAAKAETDKELIMLDILKKEAKDAETRRKDLVAKYRASHQRPSN